VRELVQPLARETPLAERKVLATVPPRASVPPLAERKERAMVPEQVHDKLPLPVNSYHPILPSSPAGAFEARTAWVPHHGEVPLRNRDRTYSDPGSPSHTWNT